jgi:hypothetical protein
MIADELGTVIIFRATSSRPQGLATEYGVELSLRPT